MKEKLTRISDFIWELPRSYKRDMRVKVRIIAMEKLVEKMEEVVLQQAANVAGLPGLVDYVIVLPDAHSGYGAPIGCVFATDPKKEGIISPGAVGYDINCGMRLLTTNLSIDDVRPRLSQLVNLLFDYVPPGVGRKGFLRLTYNELDQILEDGASWMVNKGFGSREDLDHVEEGGRIDGADPEKVSQKAKERGKLQLATLGSGNHYLEIQQVEKIFDSQKAAEWGINDTSQVVVMLHCGSRGLGHQVATDYLRSFEKKLDKYNINISDLQLACAPFTSVDGQNYFEAMNSASNFAFANRQAITYQIREVFERVFGRSSENLDMKLVYDVAHNIAKTEKELLVHRKGATRSFPNQPVIIGGSMETGSYLLLGTEKAQELTFGSTAHGSGRTMSRHQAKRTIRSEELSRQLENEGIVVKGASWGGLAEEAGFAYKNIVDVVESVEKAGISTPIAAFRPIGNIKG
jgi:tRNA-splicing ligase RtcB